MDYQIIVKISFKTMDDMAARQEARLIEEKIKSTIPEKETYIKLQEIFKDKSPRGIPL